jgi:CHAT domain-containing protein
LLVVPDGSLHALSFAALPSPSGGRPSRYLVERLSLVRDVSVSVFVAGLDARERRPVKPEVVVFGDPGPSTAATSRFRGEYGSLPASRREAESVGSLFADRARLFVGPAATEEAARAHLPQAGVAHFACHAAVDELLPLDSALVLAPDDSGGGLLQAWEIAEELRLDGALVVLSACETAKGGERAGEGIVGLVRALQVAGAESIVASLWRISDESTAELMRRFYGYLDRGVDRDEALRRAQLELLRGPIEVERDGERVRIDASSPRHWAPFVLLGAHAGRALP